MIHSCDSCKYTTSRTNDWNKHILTEKHKKSSTANNDCIKCHCGKTFKHRTNLYRHRKNCNPVNTTCSSTIPVSTEYLTSITKQNEELKSIILKQQELITAMHSNLQSQTYNNISTSSLRDF